MFDHIQLPQRVHHIGDGTVRVGLDAERAREAGRDLDVVEAVSSRAAPPERGRRRVYTHDADAPGVAAQESVNRAVPRLIGGPRYAGTHVRRGRNLFRVFAERQLHDETTRRAVQV